MVLGRFALFPTEAVLALIKGTTPAKGRIFACDAVL